MRRLAAFLCGIVCVAACVGEAAAFSIEPSRFELSVPAGRQRGKSVIIDNTDSPAPLHVRAYVQDIVFMPDGTNNFLEPGSTEWSVAKMIKVIPEELDIPAGKTATVRVNVSVPQAGHGGYYGMLFFETGMGDIKGIALNFRLGGLVDVSVPGTEARKAKLSEITLDSSRQVTIGIYNEGNVLFRPKGKLKILNPKGKRIAQVDFNSQGWGVLPKSLRKFKTELEKPLASGDYTIRAEIDYGTRYLLVGDSAVKVP